MIAKIHYISFSGETDFVLANSADPDENPHCADFVRIFIVCQSTCLGVSVTIKVLTLKAPITTAADDKFCDIFANFERNKE